jgi:hypothetical protein
VRCGAGWTRLDRKVFWRANPLPLLQWRGGELNMRKLLPLVAFALAVFLSGCSDTTAPPPAKKEAEKAEPVTGQTALFRMYQVARSWGGANVQVLKLNSIAMSEVPAVPPGTAAAWEATFISPEKAQARSYTYSVVESQGNLHKGVFPGPQQSWSGPHGTTGPFLMAAVKVDTDAAYKTALSNGGADYDKKNPGKPISFTLEKIQKFADPVWRVIWGESAGTSSFSVYVDAMTGEFKEKLH